MACSRLCRAGWVPCFFVTGRRGAAWSAPASFRVWPLILEWTQSGRSSAFWEPGVLLWNRSVLVCVPCIPCVWSSHILRLLCLPFSAAARAMLCSEPYTSLVQIRAQHARLLNLFYSYILWWWGSDWAAGLRMRAKRKHFTALLLETASSSDTHT